MIFVPRGSHTLLALIITHLVISMPAPPVKRSPELAGDLRNGFSSVPKILEIQLPLKIATKDDLVAWAKYVMGLMASRINITLATVKDTTESPLDPARKPSSYKHMQSFKTSGFKNLDPGKPAGTMKAYAKNFETSRYAENVNNYERNKNPAEFRIQDTNRYPEKSKIPAPRKESVVSTPNLQAFTTGPLTAKNFLGIRPTTFATLGISDTTVHSPLEIKANINLARPTIKESLIKGTFDVANALKINDQQFFVPTFPDFSVFSPKNIDVFNAETVPPPPRTYLPVTTTDNIRFPSDSFATRYFFDGIERNVTSNLGLLPMDLRYTTIRPVSFSEEIPLPVKSLELATRKNSTSPPKRVLNVPFEAVITFTREAKIEPTTLKSDNEKQYTLSTRDPPDVFPPYFDNNYTVTNESGQINVVFDDGSQVTEKVNAARKGEKKKKKKEKEKDKEKERDKDKDRDKDKERDKEKTKKPSMITQLLKVFTALRKTPNANNSLSVDLSPPPLKPPLSFPLPQRAPQVQEATSSPRPPQSFPQRQQAYPQSPQTYPQSPQTYPQRPQTYPQRPQTYPQNPQTYPPKPSESRQGRRNQTSLAQELEDNDDDDDSGNSGEDKSEEDKSEEDKSDQDEGSKPKDEVESDEDNGGSSESSSDESDYSDEEDDNGSVRAIINLLELAAPILEDLSDPESETNISDVLEAAVPLLEDLSNGDGVNPGVDVAGILVPILLQISGGPDGMGDSVAILTPILQVLAPLIGPLSGPLLVPLSRQSSNPPNQGASSSGNLIMNLSGPLSQSGPGMTSMLQKLVAGVVSSLSKNSGGGSDITSLIKAIVAGSISGTSASSSGPRGDSYGAPTSYGGDSYSYGGQPNRPMTPMTPYKGENPIALLGSSVNDILTAILKIVASLINAIMGILGASSAGSSDSPSPAPPPSYGPPSTYQGAPPRFMVPPRANQNNITRGTSLRALLISLLLVMEEIGNVHRNAPPPPTNQRFQFGGFGR